MVERYKFDAQADGFTFWRRRAKFKAFYNYIIVDFRRRVI